MTTLRNRATRWFHASLGARVVALFLGLLALVQVASFIAIKNNLREQAYRELPEALAVAEQVMTAQLDARAAQHSQRARVYGGDYAFGTVVKEDAETIRSVLEESAKGRTGADEVAFLGPDFSLRASSGRHIGALAPRARSLAASDGGDGNSSEIMMLAGAPHRVVIAPVKQAQGELQGWLLMSFSFEPRLIADMRALSKQQFSLLVRDGPKEPWRLALSSLEDSRAKALAAAVPADDRADMRPVSVQGEMIGLRSQWLAGGDRAGGAVLGVVSASIDEATQVPHPLQLSLLLTTLAGFAVFAVGSLYTTRRVTTPLRKLTQAAERLGSGDYDTPMRGLDRSDEIGQLAQSFESMRVSVAEQQAQNLRLAYWDTLTGLPNRAQFGKAVAQAIAEAGESRAPVAVLMLDLDRFKHVNDVLGYHFGDLLLQAVGERLTQQVMRDGDLVARLSGDEFAVLLRSGDAALAESVAQRIARAFEQPLTLQEQKVDMGAGIGIACWPEHAADADTLINRAEVAMYAAKHRGSGVLMYDPALDAASAQTLSLLGELRQAVEHGELRLFLQPKLALGTGAVVGAEALVRWQHPTRGLVPPMQFIPFAEQTGFIRQLTLWVFEASAQAWRDLHADGTVLVLSVNLSTRDLLDQDLPAKLERLLLKHRVPAEAFCLEITESAIMVDPDRSLDTLKRLSGMGFKLSIDDFGTGHSSFAQLGNLPVDELKIDRSFVMSMESDPKQARIVQSIIEMAHTLDLTVVAEGVEDAKAWDRLRDLRCDQAQGYHMGKPMPANDFLAWSARWVERRRMPGAAAATTLLH